MVDIRAAIAAEIAFVPSGADTAVLSADDETFDIASAIEKAESVSPNWIIEIPVFGEMLETLALRKNVSVFYVAEIPGSIFATTEQLMPVHSSLLLANGQIGTPVETTVVVTDGEQVTKSVTKILKTDEERYVLGVVLSPETQDSQGDIYSHDEVRKAAHGFMESAGGLGRQHSEIVTGKLKILESYIAPVDFEADSEKVQKGTWLLGIRVVDDDLWGDIKKGSFTGFSIGGQAFRKPENP